MSVSKENNKLTCVDAFQNHLNDSFLNRLLISALTLLPGSGWRKTTLILHIKYYSSCENWVVFSMDLEEFTSYSAD